MKFKNYIEAQSGIKDSADLPGTLDQVLTSTATGVAWVDPSTISAEAATLVVIECKNTSGATITKGTPVYQTGTVGATDVIEIAPADALISSGSQPAIGLLQTTLNDNGFGKVVITGEFLNFTTDPIDGVTPTTGDKIFLKSGGGLTLTKPTGAENGIQNLGLIGKVSGGSAGSITVSSIMRTNDVPNLPTGKIWVGDGNTIVSDTVFLDEPNGRMGIGTISPTNKLNVNGDIGYIGVIGQGSIYGNTGNSSFSTMQLYDPSTGYTTLNNQSYGYYFNTSGGTKVTILNGGNVGIGTTSPTKTLNVKFNSSSVDPETGEGLGGGSAGTGVLLTNSNTTVGTFANLDFRANNVDARIAVTHNATNNGDFHFILDNTAAAPVTRLIIEGETGNVGIGTTSPAYKLDVRADDGDVGQVFIKGGNSTVTAIGEINSELLFGSNDASVGQGAIGGKISSVTETSNGAYTGMAFYTYRQTSPLLTEKMRITNEGNVGIGETSPTVKLTVNENNSGLVSSITNSSSNGSGVQITAGNGTNTSLQIRNYIGGELMRVQGNGNVGIGTTSPGGKLHIHQTVNGTNNSIITEDDARKIFIGRDSIKATNLSDNPAELYIQQHGGNATFGNDVSLGGNLTLTTNARYLRAEDSAGTTTRLLGINGSNTTYIGPIDAYAGGSILYGTAAGVTFQRFFTGASERLRIGSNGNVAIGTTATSYRLQVEQDNNGNLLSRFHNTAANGQGLLIRAGGVSSANRILQLASENDTKVMTVNSNGRVGIGIVNPTEKLEVAGNIKLSGVLYVGSRGIYQAQNTDVSGLELVANASINLYRAAFFDYVIQKQGNVRAGTVFACNDGVSVEYTETSTNDIGDTSDVVLSVDISGTNMRLLADAATSGWSVKSLIRAI